MAALRVKRAGGLVKDQLPHLRVKRAGGLLVGGVPSLRVKGAGGLVTDRAPVLHVNRVGGIVRQPATVATVTIASTAPTGFAALPLQSITLTATATVPAGDSVSTWSWSPSSSTSPPVDSPSSSSTRVRVPVSLSATTLAWTVTAVTTLGVVATATVQVPAQATPLWSYDLAGVQHPVAVLGSSPVLYAAPTPPARVSLRVKRVGGMVVDKAVVAVTPSVMVGARYTYPGNGTVSQDFATGEADYGAGVTPTPQTQISKDYVSGTTLPKTYTSPFPSYCRVILSISQSISYDQRAGSATRDPNWVTWVKSLPPGTILTWQHEPERPNIFPWSSTGGGGGAQYVSYLNIFRDAVRAVRTDIPVWLISGGYSYRAGNVATDGSYFTGNNADGYGMDVYRTGEANSKALDPLNSPIAGSKQAAIGDRAEFTTWHGFIPTGKPWGISEFGDGWSRPQYDPANPTVAGTIYQTTIVQQRIANMQKSFQQLSALGGLYLLYWFSDGTAGGLTSAQSYKPMDTGFKQAWAAIPRAAAGSNPLLP